MKVLKYKRRKTTVNSDPNQLAAELNKQMQLIAWETYLYTPQIDKVSGVYMLAIYTNSGKDRISPDHQAGAIYHLWLNEGHLEHVSGFDYLYHFIKLPKTFLDTVITPESSKEVEGETIITPAVTNRDLYYKELRENATNCLVKITDANYNDLKGEITYDATTNIPLNLVCEDKYFAAIAEGGEFYVEPVNTEM